MISRPAASASRGNLVKMQISQALSTSPEMNQKRWGEDLAICVLISPAGNADMHSSSRALLAQMVKKLPAVQETRVQSLDQEDPLDWQPIPVFLPGGFHGQRSLAGYSPRGHKELDATELLT